MARVRLAQRLAARADYSYRHDPGVPPFPDDRGLIVFDGVCVLCASTVRAIARRDRAARYRFAAAQGRLGSGLMRHYGLDPENPESVLLIEDGRAYGKFDMAARIAGALGGPMAAILVLRFLPGALRDRLYDVVATRRYRLFGRHEGCIVPDAAWRDRVLDLPAHAGPMTAPGRPKRAAE